MRGGPRLARPLEARIEAGPGAALPRLRQFYRGRERVILGAVSVVLFLIFWEGLTRGWWADAMAPLVGGAAEHLRIRPIFISSPTRIVAAGYRLFFVTGAIWHDLEVSGIECLLGFLLALLVGVPLGLAAGWYRRFNYAVEPFLAALNATPQVAFLPLIIVWFGIGLQARVVVIFLLTVLPIAINAMAGVRTTDARLVRVARSFNASDWRIFCNLILPSAVPFLLAGIRLGVGRAMIGVVVGEIYGANAGIGFMINIAGARFQTDNVFVGVITIAALGLALADIIRRIERRVEAWRPQIDAAA
jgi:ABC-type nitrate/sulfonate/bicarbonate transport system permease component